MRPAPLHLLLLLLLVPASAGAILLEAGNINSTQPTGGDPDPGWANVGLIDLGLNAVYLGDGWAATASHVALTASVTFDGVSYPIVSGSSQVIQHDATHQADLKVFRMRPWPSQLPVLPIASSVSAWDDMILIGRGKTNGGPVGDPVVGYSWTSTWLKRWGTNQAGGTVNPIGFQVSFPFANGPQLTQSLVTQFDAGATSYESIATVDDSGGALFVEDSGSWELAGIQWAYTNAVPNRSSYGDDTLSVDLTYYRSKLLAIVRPCADGVDNDSDGKTDGADLQCLWDGDLSEKAACADGIDNDADGSIDLADANCSGAGDLLEDEDADGDLVADLQDNCRLLANDSQYDSNLDGYGNLCDADFNNDGAVGTPDLTLWVGAGNFGTQQGHPNFDPDFDLNADGVIGTPDLTLFLGLLGGLPGPSGLACAGTPPCQ